MIDKNLIIKTKIILAILFLLALLNMPYGYYQLLRFFGLVGFIILAYNLKDKKDFWFWFWTSSSALINPFFKVSLAQLRHLFLVNPVILVSYNIF